MKKFSLPKILQNLKYRGRPVLVVGEKAYIPQKGQNFNTLWSELEKKNPDNPPVYVHLPIGTF
ncbi:MAG: hypothetical protein Q7S14_03050 [bacterium]|nr:hypothetical protein [bacterium]